MKQVWQAENGSIFDSEEACRDFEKRYYCATGIKYIVDDKIVVPKNLKEEEKIMNAAQYIFIPKEIFPEAVDRLEEKDFTCPHEPGVFAWDGEREGWVNLEKEVALLKRYEKIIQEFTEK